MLEKEFKKTICKRIVSLRKECGLKQEQLAYQSDVSKGGLSEIERNLKMPIIYTVAKICSGLGITMSEFFASKEIENFVDKL